MNPGTAELEAEAADLVGELVPPELEPVEAPDANLGSLPPPPPPLAAPSPLCRPPSPVPRFSHLPAGPAQVDEEEEEGEGEEGGQRRRRRHAPPASRYPLTFPLRSPSRAFRD